MKHAPVVREASPSDMAELYEELEPLDSLDIRAVETKLAAHQISRECLEELNEFQRLDRVEQLTTEAAELVTAVGAGAISTYRNSANRPTGATFNVIAGGIAKLGSAIYAGKAPVEISELGRTVRATCRAGKTLLHAQLAIATHNVMRKPKP